MATVAMLLVFFSTGFVLEMMLIYEGTQGGGMRGCMARSPTSDMHPLQEAEGNVLSVQAGPLRSLSAGRYLSSSRCV